MTLLNALSKKDTRRLDAIKEKKRALTKKEQQAKQKESKKKKNHKKNQKKKQKKIAEEFYDYYSDDDDYYYEPVLSIWHDGPATLVKFKPVIKKAMVELEESAVYHKDVVKTLTQI
ncbi:hypothetical protein TSUD_343800 [Trifolium subterraneum]|nr:hypothetical protein TSUD_343800 [Trifolium subterraneum]